MKETPASKMPSSPPWSSSKNLATFFLVFLSLTPGFIGLPVALAYARAGHIVYGTTRDQKAARQLAKHEIVPLVTPANGAHGHAVWGKIAHDIDIGEYRPAADDFPFQSCYPSLFQPAVLTTVIDTIRSMDAEQPLGALRAVEAIPGRGTNGTRITYIYTGTSGSHSRGLGGLDTWSTEQNPAASQEAWRTEVETAVLNSEWRCPNIVRPAMLPLTTGDKVNGIVIRPAVLYGRSGSMLEPFLFAPAYDAAKAGGTFEVIGLPETRFLTVHQDDLADLYLRAGERVSAYMAIREALLTAGTAPQRQCACRS